MRFDINGHTNPVEAAKLSMQAMGFEIDEASFDILAAKRGEATAEEIGNGFLISGFDDLKRLAEIGNIVIVFEDGIVTAYDPSIYAQMKGHRIPANPRLGFDPTAHNVRRDLAMADQIVADQRLVGETVGETAPGADDATAVRSSENLS